MSSAVRPGNRFEAAFLRNLGDDHGRTDVELLVLVRVLVPVAVGIAALVVGVAGLAVAFAVGAAPVGMAALVVCLPAFAWAVTTVVGEAADWIRRIGPYSRPPYRKEESDD